MIYICKIVTVVQGIFYFVKLFENSKYITGILKINESKKCLQNFPVLILGNFRQLGKLPFPKYISLKQYFVIQKTGIIKLRISDYKNSA